jgi:ankyrin repeat protein
MEDHGLAKALLTHGADANHATDYHGRTPLWEAWVRDRIKLCALQLEYGADTSGLNSSEREPLLRRVERWQKWGI